MLPLEVLITLPIPFFLALLVITTYYLLPLLHLLPRPGPLVSKITNLIPHPRKARNLPREFFNLPPRPGSPNGSISSTSSLSMGAALGVRGKIMLMMVGQAGLALIAGWIYLAIDVTGRIAGLLLALSIIPLPTSIATITLFSVMRKPHHIARHELSLFRSAIFGSGGITHTTIIPRILPYSSIATALIAVIAVIIPSAGIYILVMAGLLSSSSIVMASTSLQRQSRARRGMIRLASPSPEPYPPEGHIALTDEYIRAFKDSDSMVSSPSRPPTPASAFSYSPSVKSARSGSETPKSGAASQYDTPKTSITEYTATPSTIPSWVFTHSPTPTLPTPSSAITRPRSPSVALPEVSSPRTLHKGSTVANSSMYTQTLSSTPGSPLGSAGGSILAGYSPDPFHPMPRGFESLTSFPLTPSQLASRATARQPLVERTNRSSSAFAFIPAQQSGTQGRETTWTLESYHSQAYQTPKSQVRGGSHRAPPPPPLPYPMPLPPTPTAARSETIWEQSTTGGLGKDSTGLLMGCERDWDVVDLSEDSEELESWGTDGRGVGIISLAGMLACLALAAPMLAIGLSQTTQALYLISILIPSFLLLISTYLLRPRRMPNFVHPRNIHKGSKTSLSTHQSLALRTESQLSLPATISPKLTPPLRKQPSVPLGEKWSSLLEPKPSISSFGYKPPASKQNSHRRHTVYGALDARDMAAEENMRKTLARRSVDIWLEAGHAKPAGNVFERAAEMIKPTPALRIMDGQRVDTQSVLKKLRGGVVSMLPKRFSQIRGEGASSSLALEMTPPRTRASAYEDADEPQSPITIHITSPSKFERRRSGLARSHSAEPSVEEGVTGDNDGEIDGEIQTATRARMSASPTYFFGKERAGDGDEYELDWLQSSILPQLIPGIQLPSAEDVDPDEQFADAETPHISRTRRRSSFSSAPTHLRNASADFNPPEGTTTSTSPRRELRHKHSFSLPPIDKASFSDLRSQVRQVGKERQHHWSIYSDAPTPVGAIDFSAPRNDEYSLTGIDLPAFPIIYPSTPKSLSTVDEANETIHSSGLRSLAHLTLSAEERFSSLTYSINTSPHRERSSIDSALVGQDSFVSDEEAMAREMEQVLAMDTPTRAEFVISPTGSEATTVTQRTSWSRSTGYRPLSRASSAGSVLEGRVDKAPSGGLARRRSNSSVRSAATEYTMETATTDYSPRQQTIVVPPVPDIPVNLRRPVSQNFAHPFPVHNAAASIPLPAHITSNLDKRQSQSVPGAAAQSEPASARPPSWRNSKQDLKLVAIVAERAEAAKAQKAEEMEQERLGRVEKEVHVIEQRAKAFGSAPPTHAAKPPSPARKPATGLRPLKLLANRPPSVVGQATSKVLPGNKAVTNPEVQVTQIKEASVHSGSIPPATPSRRKSKGSKTKENMPMAQTPGSRKVKGGKGSKTSNGPSGVSGIRA